MSSGLCIIIAFIIFTTNAFPFSDRRKERLLVHFLPLSTKSGPTSSSLSSFLPLMPFLSLTGGRKGSMSKTYTRCDLGTKQTTFPPSWRDSICRRRWKHRAVRYYRIHWNEPSRYGRGWGYFLGEVWQWTKGPVPETEQLIKELSMPEEIPGLGKKIDCEITEEDFISGFKAWKESTSTSPSGRHLGHTTRLFLTLTVYDPDLKKLKILRHSIYEPPDKFRWGIGWRLSIFLSACDPTS